MVLLGARRLLGVQAGMDGRIQQGDLIISVNGRALRGATEDQVVDILASCGGQVGIPPVLHSCLWVAAAVEPWASTPGVPLA